MSIDRKFQIVARSIVSNNHYTEDNAVLFLAKDKAFLLTLPTYLEKCKEVGAAPEQIKAVELLIARVADYQAKNPGVVKVPDVDPTIEADCLKP